MLALPPASNSLLEIRKEVRVRIKVILKRPQLNICSSRPLPKRTLPFLRQQNLAWTPWPSFLRCWCCWCCCCGSSSARSPSSASSSCLRHSWLCVICSCRRELRLLRVLCCWKNESDCWKVQATWHVLIGPFGRSWLVGILCFFFDWLCFFLIGWVSFWLTWNFYEDLVIDLKFPIRSIDWLEIS